MIVMPHAHDNAEENRQNRHCEAPLLSLGRHTAQCLLVIAPYVESLAPLLFAWDSIVVSIHFDIRAVF